LVQLGTEIFLVGLEPTLTTASHLLPSLTPRSEFDPFSESPGEPKYKICMRGFHTSSPVCHG